MPARYRNLFLLILAFVAVFAVVETTLRAIGSPWLLTQRNGPGQVALYLIGLAAILWFGANVAKVPPIDFTRGYLRDWRRGLRGFIFAWLVGTTAMVVIHGVMLATGAATFSSEAWADYGLRAFRSTVTAMLVMLVLVLSEEMIFRGFVLRYLRWSAARSVTIAAVVVAAAIFSFSHTVSLGSRLTGDDIWNLLFGLFMLGLLLGTVYVTTGSLFCAMGIHAALLGFKVFLRKTQFIDYTNGALTGGNDLRTGPIIWLIMLAFTVGFILARRWLWERYWIERAYVPEPAGRRGLGFRLDADPSASAAVR